MQYTPMENTSFLGACWRRPSASGKTPVWYMRQAGRCLPEYRELKKRYDILTLCRTPELAMQVSLMPIKTFGVDAAILFADIMLPLIAMGVDLNIVEAVGPVIKNPIDNAGNIAALRDIDPADLAYLSKTISLVLGELHGTVPLIGFSGAPFTLASYLIEGKPSRDFVKTKIFMHSQPEVWAQLMEALTRNVVAYLNVQVAAGVQAVQLFDSWVGCLSAEDYAQFVLPYSRKIFSALAPAKIPRIHFGVNTTAFLEDFASVDCEVVGVDWRLPLATAWQKIGGAVGAGARAIQGNLDPVLLLGDFSIAKKKVDEIFASLDDRTGFIFNLGHGVLPETPYENLIKLTEHIHAK
jgi:uroporphyrinogen decarboxylase